VADPSRSFELIVETYGFQPAPFEAGVHPSAVVAGSVKFDAAKVSVGPNAVIEAGVELADGVEIGAGCFVGRNARIGSGSKLFANSTVHAECILGSGVILHSSVVIGGDGFGYEFSQGRHRKVRQAGIVQIDNEVEIGAGTTVDRARFGRTWIGEGTKIDNLVQIGHNCIIGKHCIIVSQTGISGSTRLGNYVTMGGQVGVAGHLEICDQAMFFAKSGVTKSIHQPGAYTGFPARPLMEGRKMLSLPAKIPDLLDRVRELEKKIAALEGGGHEE
jgi:UDP-3-O-[3-hydroxymyristoyl] glucosamine N-acyltransferase